MTEPTALDLAHADMETSDSARLRFFAVLADTELYLLLEREASGDAIEPRLFPVDGGEVALAFDTEARLAEFTGQTAHFAALPGRVLADLLGSQGFGLGLNLDVAPSATLLRPEDLRWLTQTLGADGPAETDQRITALHPPRHLPDALLSALADRLIQASGLAASALLAEVEYRDGSSGNLLAIMDAEPRARPALARAVNEALTFSGVETGMLDVAFFDAGDRIVTQLRRVAMRFEIPAPAAPRSHDPSAPGMNPDRPPKLR